MTSNDHNLLGPLQKAIVQFPSTLFDRVDVGWRFVKMAGAADIRWIKGSKMNKVEKSR